MAVENEHPDPGQQGRAAHHTGSTSQGGSNYGQGSSQLGGESYQQGSESNEGSNYNNEAQRLGNSSTGTNFEGSSSPSSGEVSAKQPNEPGNLKSLLTDAVVQNDLEIPPEVNDTDTGDIKKLFDADDHNTTLEKATGMSTDLDPNQSKSRGWSAGTIDQ